MVSGHVKLRRNNAHEAIAQCPLIRVLALVGIFKFAGHPKVGGAAGRNPLIERIFPMACRLPANAQALNLIQRQIGKIHIQAGAFGQTAFKDFLR